MALSKDQILGAVDFSFVEGEVPGGEEQCVFAAYRRLNAINSKRG